MSSLNAAATPYYPPGAAQGQPARGACEQQSQPAVLELASILDSSTSSTRSPSATSPHGQDGVEVEDRGGAYMGPSPTMLGYGQAGTRLYAGCGDLAKFARKRVHGPNYLQDELPSKDKAYTYDQFTTNRLPYLADKAARAAAQLRQLLDFYFESFNLQHNRYLLDLIARRIGKDPYKVGPWLTRSLADFTFSLGDLVGLGRIASALAKLKSPSSEHLEGLKHLKWSTGFKDPRMKLMKPPEVRSLVASEKADPEVVSAAATYLAAVREQRSEAPKGLFTVLAYALEVGLCDNSTRGMQRQAQLKRQLLLHHTDVMCLQGLDPDGIGEGIVTTLTEEGYSFTVARCATGEANSVFWDASRLQLVGFVDDGAAVAVELTPFEEPSIVIRVTCVRPMVPTSDCPGLKDLLGDRSGPLVVCADLSLLGGTESADVFEELAGMRSVAKEVLGEELQTPMAAPLEEGHTPVRGGASNWVRLHKPDAMFFEGLVPLMALSGHTASYLQGMTSEECSQQFPAFRLPIVAAFDWRTN